MRHAKTLRQHLIAELQTQFDGDAWHGHSLHDILEGVTADDASRRVGSAHTIWEIVRHIAGWTREVARRLEGGEAGEPPEGDWPAVSDVSETAWRAAKGSLRRAQNALLTILEDLPDARLHRPVRDFRSSPEGIGATVAETISGLLQHDVYHAGQIALLKRLVQERPRRAVES